MRVQASPGRERCCRRWGEAQSGSQGQTRSSMPLLSEPECLPSMSVLQVGGAGRGCLS